MVQFGSDVSFWNNQLFLGDPCHIKMRPLILYLCLWPFPKGREFCAKKLCICHRGAREYRLVKVRVLVRRKKGQGYQRSSVILHLPLRLVNGFAFHIRL